MRLAEAVERHVVRLRVTGKSPRTVDTYRAALRSWARWSGACELSDAITEDALMAYRAHIARPDVRPRTLNVQLCALRSLINEEIRRARADRSVLDALRPVTEDMAERPVPTDDDVDRLFDAARRLYPHRRSAIALALLVLFACAGLRLQEALDLRLCDVEVDETGAMIRVRAGKGGKPRPVPLRPEVAEMLRPWARLRGPASHQWYLSRNASHRISEVGVYSVLDELASIAGVDNASACRPHALRHWHATTAHRSGVRLEDLRVRLGHARIETTAVYVHSDAVRQQEVALTLPVPGHRRSTQGEASRRYRRSVA